jgi:hypothetical protein
MRQTILSTSILKKNTILNFDVEDITNQQVLELHGYLATTYKGYYTDDSTMGYELQFYNQEEVPEYLNRFNIDCLLEADFKTEYMGFSMKSHSDFKEEELGFDLYEAKGNINLASFAYLQAGKIIYNWGKGYAFNSVGFVNPQKDPADPEAINNGLISFDLELTKSFSSDFFRTIALSTIIIPAVEDIENFADITYTDFAGKLYLLLGNLDLDIMGYYSQDKPIKAGADLAVNILENLELHGEFAYSWQGLKESFVDNTFETEETDDYSFLVGSNLLTPWDMSITAEYYYNRFGLSRDEYLDFMNLIQERIETENPNLINTTKRDYLAKLNSTGLMQKYLYFRVLQPEPFNLVYFNPALSLLWNIDDNSLFFSLPLSWKPVNNFEIVLQPNLMWGRENTEFGERSQSFRVDLKMSFHY